jgi:hypothetical protein
VRWNCRCIAIVGSVAILHGVAVEEVSVHVAGDAAHAIAAVAGTSNPSTAGGSHGE